MSARRRVGGERGTAKGSGHRRATEGRGRRESARSRRRRPRVRDRSRARPREGGGGDRLPARGDRTDAQTVDRTGGGRRGVAISASGGGSIVGGMRRGLGAVGIRGRVRGMLGCGDIRCSQGAQASSFGEGEGSGGRLGGSRVRLRGRRGEGAPARRSGRGGRGGVGGGASRAREGGAEVGWLGGWCREGWSGGREKRWSGWRGGGGGVVGGRRDRSCSPRDDAHESAVGVEGRVEGEGRWGLGSGRCRPAAPAPPARGGEGRWGGGSDSSPRAANTSSRPAPWRIGTRLLARGQGSRLSRRGGGRIEEGRGERRGGGGVRGGGGW